MKYRIDPTVDCVFKAILGADENKNLLIHFLNSVLEIEGELKIKDVEIKNPYNERQFINDKLSIVDIRAIDDQNKQYQIEIQLAVYADLIPRILYTWSRMYHAQLLKGGNYLDLKPVISIWVIKNILFNELSSYHIPFGIFNIENKLELTEHFGIHILQLPKFKSNRTIKKNKDIWTYFFKEGKDMDINNLPKSLNIPEINQAFKTLERFSENEKDYLLYQSRLDKLREIDTLKTRYEKEREEKEKIYTENERLKLILKKAGINPDK
jgi:predicted transposase/invertase (TIGR01784 family)